MPPEKANILIVDDTPANLRLLSDLLSQQGYVARAARSASMALNALETFQPQLILLDIMMPEVDGFTLCEQLKADPITCQIPIIFISALDDSSKIVHAFEIGGVDYVTKPFREEEVLARVRTHLLLNAQRNQIEQMHQRDKERFETLNEMRENFIRAATHDMRTPLSVVVGYTTMLSRYGDKLDKATTDDYIERILHGSSRIQTLISDMLDLISFDWHANLSTVVTPLDTFLMKFSTDFAMLSAQKRIDFHVEIPPMQISANIDDAKMTRVVENLLSNAIKYTPEGKNVILKLDHDNQFAFIQVIDTGYGIDSDNMPNLFNSFYRIPRTEHTDVEGTGLGLSIAKTIVEQHGGTIEVESTVNVGSCFTIKLPLASPVNEDQQLRYEMQPV